jgi:hypothetical protein
MKAQLRLINALGMLTAIKTGRWDGDSLVVDTHGFNGKTWLDQTGKPTSDALHVTERFGGWTSGTWKFK